jgi:hypothetical protein
MKYQSVAALLLAVSAAGCADLRWHRDGADAAALGRDLDECRQLARAQAAHEAWPLGVATPRIVGVDALGRAIVSSPGQVDTNRFFVEHDLARFCMRSRGYELVPVEKR